MTYQDDPSDPTLPPAGGPVHPLDRVPQPPQQVATPPPSPQPRPRRVEFPTNPPVMTYVLLGINVAVFLLDMGLHAAGYGVGSTGPLTVFGAKNNRALLHGQYWRLVTPLFLHGGILHIGFNSYFLYLVGRQIERAYGWARFLALYFLSGIAGTIVSFAFSPYDSIGASGALFGIIGAFIPFLIRNQKILADTRKQIGRIAQVIVINLLIGLMPGIDNWAHLGGLLGGLILGLLTTPEYAVAAVMPDAVRLEDRRSGLVWLSVLGFAVALGGVFVLLLMIKG